MANNGFLKIPWFYNSNFLLLSSSGRKVELTAYWNEYFSKFTKMSYVYRYLNEYCIKQINYFSMKMFLFIHKFLF